MPSLTDELCTRCGLCCDGSLFAEVELAGRAETRGLEILGLDVEEDDGGCGLLMQPCAALRGTRCGIYAHRPECCRTFECRLLQDARRGAVSVERARERIAAARKAIRRTERLLVRLGQRVDGLPLRERCADALALGDGASPRVKRGRAELAAAMSVVDALIRKTFLDDRAKT
jgi:hypothetical protein